MMKSDIRRDKFQDNNGSRTKLVAGIILSLSIWGVGIIQTASAAGSGATTPSNSDTSASSSQPLWSYQVKPSGLANYLNGGHSSSGHSNSYPTSTLMDAFNGLSQRQGALSNSPFLSILPIILIAAGGMLLLLPFLTMMMASPFGGGLPGYGPGAFGYPQVNAGLNAKKRSLGGLGTTPDLPRGLNDILEQVSSTIDELTRKYTVNPASPSVAASSTRRQNQQQQVAAPTATNEQQLQASHLHQTGNLMQTQPPSSPSDLSNNDYKNINSM